MMVRHQNRSPLWGVFALLVLMSAVLQSQAAAQGGGPPQAPTVPLKSSSNEPLEYVLQRGDELDISVYNIPELAAHVKVRPDGKISLQLLDDVQAAGSTPLALAQFLSESYSKVYRNPRVTVSVRNFATQVVYVGGEVFTPGQVPIPGELTISGALMHAGGFKESAQIKNVVLLRNSGEQGKPIVKKFNLQQVLQGKEEDVKLRPFDVVYVPRSTVAKIDLFMKQYIRDLLPVMTTAGFSYLLGATTIQ